MFDTKINSNYDVITMKTSIIKIGNSRGIRIPKTLLQQIMLTDEAEITIKDNGLFITPSSSAKGVRAAWGPSYNAFAKEWDLPEEDEAWASLQ